MSTKLHESKESLPQITVKDISMSAMLDHFLQLMDKHSGVESNINELEHCGLDRGPDRGYGNYQRYIAFGVTAYNLRRIGKQLLTQDAEIKLKRTA